MKKHAYLLLLLTCLSQQVAKAKIADGAEVPVSSPYCKFTVHDISPVDTTSDTREKEAIKKLLSDYRKILNASDINKVLPFYTADAVFMAAGLPTAVGADQIKNAYEVTFKMLKLDVVFHIDEIVVHDDWALLRTHSTGTTLFHATGKTVPEANRELFILRKENGKWKFWRYMFNQAK